MRPLKLVAVVLFFSLVVTVFFVYNGNISVLQKGSTEEERRQYVSLEGKRTDSMKVDEDSHLTRDLEDIYLDLEKLLKRQSALNSKDSLSRSDFETVVTLSLLIPPIQNISRMLTPSSHTFHNYIGPAGLPVIFTDMLVGTNMDNWSWDYVREKWGNTLFHNTRQGNYSAKVDRFGKHKIHRVSVILSNFIDVVTGKRKPHENEKRMYITKQKMLPTEDLEKEFYYPPFYSTHKKCFLEPTGWIGASGTFTQGHIDSKDNFVYQLIGKKKWTIFPPHDYHYLYYKQEKGTLEWSAVLSQKEKPDLDLYPLYQKTHPITFIMNPGEVLYLPRGWTHFVENITPSLMFNTWRRGPPAITEPWIEKNREAVRKLCFQ